MQATTALAEPAAPLLDRSARFDALDAIRAVASIGVVVTHVSFQTGTTNNGTWAGFLARLDSGVALFFVLSGFLLFLPYARRRFAGAVPPATGPYLWRRALRILPAYWLVVVMCFVLLPENAKVTSADWIRHLLLLQNYQPNTLRAGLTQTWSLVTEVSFYLLLPVLATIILGRHGTPLSDRRPLRVLGLFVAFSIAWLLVSRIVDEDGSQPLGSWLPGTLAWFSVGMALALLRAWFEQLGSASLPLAWVRDLAKAPGSCWLLALFLFAVATTPVAGPRLLFPSTGWEMVAKTLLYGTAAAFIVLPLVLADQSGSRFIRALSVRPLRWLGELSYSIFLWHLLVLASVYELTDIKIFQGRFWSVLGLTLAGTMVVSTLSYLLLERPLLRLKSSYPFQSGRSGQDGSTVATTQPTASTPSAVAPDS